MVYKKVLEHSIWLRDRQADEYWTVVAQRRELDRGGMLEKLRMASVLAPVVAAEKLLADRRGLDVDALGSVDASGGGQPGMHVGNNVAVEPFAFLCDARPDGPCITNDFVQFYGLRLDAGKYVAVDNACEDVDVVRIVDNAWLQEISVSTRFLRNYLACRGRVLVRWHDNLVRLNREPNDLGIERFRGRAVDGPSYAFRLETADWSGDLAAGRLTGKDLVMPFKKRRDPLAPQGGRCEFVVGIDDQGREVSDTYRDVDEMCGAASSYETYPCERLALYAGEAGMCKYCFPVHFRPGVLKKYLESDRHEVDYGKVSCARWSIKAFIDDRSGILDARLGDLARLPACEQHHWRSYNVPPEGIGGMQYAGFGSTVTSAQSVGYGAGEFRKSFDNFQERFMSMFGFTPFMPLSAGDAHRMEGIRIPLSDELAEFEACIQDLSILLNDSIDVERLKEKLIGWGEWEKFVDKQKNGEPRAMTSDAAPKVQDKRDDKWKNGEPRAIPMLERFLEFKSLPTTIIPCLYKIQRLRSSGVAHRKGSNYERNTRRYGLDEVGPAEFVHRLLGDLTMALDTTLSDTARPRAG